jgi:hypothetical protein
MLMARWTFQQSTRIAQSEVAMTNRLACSSQRYSTACAHECPHELSAQHAALDYNGIAHASNI